MKSTEVQTPRLKCPRPGCRANSKLDLHPDYSAAAIAWNFTGVRTVFRSLFRLTLVAILRRTKCAAQTNCGEKTAALHLIKKWRYMNIKRSRFRTTPRFFATKSVAAARLPAIQIGGFRGCSLLRFAGGSI
jgi:hypothetical protein